MAGRTALVLGGGGLAGIAWEIGVLRGLLDDGVDLTTADVVIGTSAGSVVGAQVTSGTSVADLYDAQLVASSGEIAAAMGRGAMLQFALSAVWPGDERKARARLGRAALKADTVPAADRRTAIESRLPATEWPQRRLLVTAVDAESGDLAVFDAASGVSLVDAVGASCAVPLVWPPVTIDGHRYIDGGARSTTNADLAAGCDRVVVLAPVALALRRSGRVSHQLSTLGPGVVSSVVTPDATAKAAFGKNVLDPATRKPSAEAGRAQGLASADRIRGVWPSA